MNSPKTQLDSDPIYLLDAGNTRIKWALQEGARFVATGAVATAESGQLASHWPAAPVATRAIASNVAGPRVAADMTRACADRGIALEIVRSLPAQLGVTNGYADPGQLGTDRWVALVAAHRVGKGAKLVVNVGTALTIDALAADGRFLGGLIVPGPALMRRSLDRGTAGLRLTEGVYRDFPKSTPDAITSGALQAAVGAIERMAHVMSNGGQAPAAIVLSGGAATEVAPHLSLPVEMREHLVLEGLALIARA